jgi:6-phosphogluconolactonase
MPTPTDLRVFADLDALSRGAAEEFIALAGRACGERGRFAVALSGGSTPKKLYEMLSAEPLRGRVEWEKVHFFFTDERHVPPDHPDNNYRMAYRALLSKLPAPPGNANRMATELEDAAEVADHAEASLRDFFHLAPGQIPRFDLMLLGLGADGHTASLFPGSPVLRETGRLVAAVRVEALQANRLTLTLPVINNAAEVLFLVSGTAKARALRDVLEGPPDPERLPAQSVRPSDGRLVYFVDGQAAALLDEAQRDSS